MSEVCTCKREKDFARLEERMSEVERSHKSDHDLLTEINIKFDYVLRDQKTILEKIEAPAKETLGRVSDFKYFLITMGASLVITFAFNLIIRKLGG